MYVANGSGQNWQEKAKKEKQERQNKKGRHRWNREIAKELEEARLFKERQDLLHAESERKRQEELRLRQQILDAESEARKQLEKEAMEGEQRRLQKEAKEAREAREEEQRRLQEEREQKRKVQARKTALAWHLASKQRQEVAEEACLASKQRQEVAEEACLASKQRLAELEEQRQELTQEAYLELRTKELTEELTKERQKLTEEASPDEEKNPGLEQAMMYKLLSKVQDDAVARGADKELEVIEKMFQTMWDKPFDKDTTRTDDSATARRSKKKRSQRRGRKRS